MPLIMDGNEDWIIHFLMDMEVHGRYMTWSFLLHIALEPIVYMYVDLLHIICSHLLHICNIQADKYYIYSTLHSHKYSFFI